MGVLDRLAGLVPGWRLSTAPAPPVGQPPAPAGAGQTRADKVLATTTAALAPGEVPRRPRPIRAEKVPSRAGGIAGQIQFLPWLDSATKDSEGIRGAMRLMLRSPWVKAAWVTQILAVASQDYQVHPADDTDLDSREQADFLRHCIDNLPLGMAGLVLSVTMPLGPDGVSVVEKVNDVAGPERGKWAGKIVPVAAKAKDLLDIRLLGDRYRNTVGVRAVKRGGEEYDARDFLITRYLPLFEDPLGQAAFRASYSAYWMLDTVQKLRGIHHEKRTAGTLVGKYKDEGDIPELERALTALKTATWGIIPEDVMIQVLQLTNASETDFKSFEDDKKTEIVTGIAMATLHIMQGNVTDARGDTQVQQETSELGPWYLAKLVEASIDRQFTPDYIDWNFPAVRGYPRVTLGQVTQDEAQKLLDTVQRAQAIGFDDLSKDYYAKAASLQRAAPGDAADRLTPPQPAQQQPPPPAGGLAGFSEKGGAGRPPATFPPATIPPPTPATPAATAGVTRPAALPFLPLPVIPATFADAPPAGPAPPTDQFALPGADGRRAVDLLRRSKDEGAAELVRLADQAVRRLAADPDWRSAATLFDDAELGAVKDALAATVAGGDLLGRARVIGLARRATADAQAFAEAATDPAPYGYCPECRTPGTSRDRSPGGNDACGNGHSYPSKSAKFSYAGVPLGGAIAEKLKGLGAMIADGDLGDDGRENDPHVTARYGLHTADPDAVARAVSGFGPVSLRLGRPAAFRGEESGKPYDVLYAEVDSPDLVRLHAALGTLPHTDTHADYHPHATIGYVKAGLADKYLGLFGGRPLGDEHAAGQIEFSDPARNKVTIPLAAPGVRTFAEGDPFAAFADPPPALAPQAAVDYFRRLVPTLGVDPARYGPLLDRHAFTLAHATDQVLLGKVKDALAAILEGRAADAAALAGVTGGPPPSGPEVVQRLLDAAGASPRNPQYAEMVFRTNALDAYHAGTAAELARPEMQELFPAWEYLGIDDGRAGADHRPKFGRLYPNTAAFAAVRGPRVFNCRCSQQPLTKDQIGTRPIETTW